MKNTNRINLTMIALICIGAIFYTFNQGIKNSKKKMKELTKTQIEDLAQQTAEAICEGGEKDVLELYTESKKKEYFEKCLQKNLEVYAIEERQKYPEKRLEKYDCKIELSRSGDRYDYEKDVEYKKKKDDLKSYELELKKAAMSTGTYFDENGTMINKVPVKSYGKEIIKIIY